MQGPTISPYDNDTSLLYKYAHSKNVPVLYVRIRPRRASDPINAWGRGDEVFFALSDLLSEVREDNQRAIRDVSEYAPDLTPKELSGLFIVRVLDIADPDAITIEIFNEVNRFYRRLRPKEDGFDGLHDIQTFYRDFISTFNEQLENEQKVIQRVTSNQKIFELLAQEPPLPISPITVSGRAVTYAPTFISASGSQRQEDRRVYPEDGLDIFNQTVLSAHVPFVQYNDGERKYFKVYKGETIEEQPNLDLITGLSSGNNEAYKLFMVVWTGDPQDKGREVFYDSPKNSFNRVEYSLTSNSLTINTPLSTEGNLGVVASTRVQRALPMLHFGSEVETKLGGWFDMFFIGRGNEEAGAKPLKLERVTFLDTLINNSLMPYYFYTEERTRPFALKKNIDVNYRSIFEEERKGPEGEATSGAIVATKIKQLRAEVNETREVLVNDKPVLRTLPLGTYYLHIKITKAVNRKVLDEFIRLFRLLMIYHELDQKGYGIREVESGEFVKVKLDTYQTVFEQYAKYIPEIDELSAPELISTKKEKQEGRKSELPSKNKQLQEVAPDLFLREYGRRCLCPVQPIPIQEKDIQDWENYTYMEKGVAKKRVVRRYPEKDGWYFVCPGNANPHVNFKENRWPENKDKYPFIPCCSKKPRPLGEYPQPKVGAKAENIIITQKIVQPEGLALVPKHIAAALKNYIPGATGVTILRQGVIFSVNSFLHSVCTAMDEEDERRPYSSLSEDRDKEAYVRELRKAIVKNTRPELLRQEFYDYSDQAIMTLLSDLNTFFDPLLFYRAVEEYFQINIYIFSTSKDEDEDSDGRMLIPRHRKFHAHAQRPDRKTVLIFRNMGSESDLLAHPQCELIIDRTEEGKNNYEITTLFGSEMTELCHGIMLDTLGTITWDDLHRTNPDLYGFVDYYAMVNHAASGQHMDSDGRIQGLNFKLEWKGKQTDTTMFFPPSQPANIPATKKVHYPPASLILDAWDPNLFTSTARNPANKDQVIGLWYRVFSLQEGVFFPIQPILASTNDMLAKAPIGPASPIPLSTKGSITKRVRKLERTLNLLMQLVEWLYLVHSRGGPDLDNFYRSYFAYDPYPVEDSAEYYDFSQLPRRLPHVDSVSQGIALMSKYAPTLFNQGKIAMYSAAFAAKVLKTLKGNLALTGLINLRLKERVNPDKGVTQLRGYYLYEEDFRSQPNVVVLIGIGNLHRWLHSVTVYSFDRSFFVYHSILPETVRNVRYTRPYVFSSEGNYYLIQNVFQGTKEEAGAVAKTWLEMRFNPGYHPEPLTPEELQIMKIYKPSDSEGIALESDLARGLSPHIELLHYSNGHYAAMLRLV